MYLLDSNIYINFYDRYYKMKYFPSFWQKLSDILNQNVLIPKIVVSETYQDENFKNWLRANCPKNNIDHRTFISEWVKVLNHVKKCGFYTDYALVSDRGWANEKIADAWIIAIARKLDLTIVTDEVKNVNLNNKNPSKHAKIPDVCDQLEVRCISMNQFFEEVDLHV